SYAKFSPVFKKLGDGRYKGGQFHDGRAHDLAAQAGLPILNPIEMAMPNKGAVVARLKKNPHYYTQFPKLFGTDVWQNDDQAYAGLTQSLAAFQSLPEISPFDSKYDRFLRGEAKLTKQEELGRTLFFSQQFTNCNQCHQLRSSPLAKDETFSDYTYHNIGVPVHKAVRDLNGLKGKVDDGLLANPLVSEPSERGKFKVPTLRNVAVTGPYMHNGVFKDLRTVVAFYNKYNSKSSSRQINPETNKPWGEPEVSENLSVKELTHGPALDDRRIDALVAFMKTLTDQRYEFLLKD
ncbi:MAG: cytochrome-c peroxidase, partial [Pontibacterium sp.]